MRSTTSSTYEVRSAANAPIRTFDCPSKARAFARQNQEAFPGCRAVVVTTTVTERPIYTRRKPATMLSDLKAVA